MIFQKKDGTNFLHIKFVGSLVLTAIFSLFIPLYYEIGYKIRPFDLLLAASFVFWGSRGQVRGATTAGVMLVAVYFLYTVVRTFFYDDMESFKIMLQMFEILYFMIVVLSISRSIDYDEMILFFLRFAAVLISLTAVWHIATGSLTGWKSLDDTKYIFVFVCPALCYLGFSGRSKSWVVSAAFFVLFLVIVMSGERKALFVYMYSLLALVIGGRFKILHVAFGMIIAGLFTYILVVSDEYLTQQLDSIYNVFSRFNSLDYVDEHWLALLENGVTPSNAHRIFSNDLAKKLLDENYLFGNGAGFYLRYVQTHFFQLPDFMLLGIHDEFLRSLAEGGAVGLALYSLVWLRSLYFVIRLGKQNRDAALVCSVFVFAAFIHCRFEGGGLHAFVVVALCALLPDLYRLNVAEAARFTPPRALRPRSRAT